MLSYDTILMTKRIIVVKKSKNNAQFIAANVKKERFYFNLKRFKLKTN